MERARRRRVILLALVVFAMGAGIGLRLYYLQVLLCDEFRERARNQSLRHVEVTAPRGSILDRNGQELAVSLATESLIVHPWMVEDPDFAARKIAPLIGRPTAWVRKQFRAEKSRWLSRFMEPDVAKAVRQLDLPVGAGKAFEFLPESKRYYPRGRLGVHVVGVANIDGVGIEGVEKQFDDRLRSDPTVYVELLDARNGRLEQVIRAPGKKPQDVILTLDMILQHLVERELERALGDSGAKAGSVILLDPETGQILAMANRPAADPNRYGKAAAAARLNRAVVHEYEPGSTFKLVTMAAALELGAVRADQRYDCEQGLLSYRGRLIRDISRNGVLSARQIFQKSSNIGMSKIVRPIEPRTFREAIAEFGFGSRTGIELPGERYGTLRPVTEWNGYSQASISFGQEIGVTVLQMAAAFGAIANDGVLIPPRVVLGSRTSGGTIHRSPQPSGRRVVSGRTAGELISMLESVITGGTGSLARVPGYRLGGKSGTAQKVVDGKYSDTEHIASFGGIGPVRNPRVACLVVLDSPEGGGGAAAAPVFGRIMGETLRHLRVPSETEWLTVDSRPSTAGGGAAR